jgi:hypothetical protein
VADDPRRQHPLAAVVAQKGTVSHAAPPGFCPAARAVSSWANLCGTLFFLFWSRADYMTMS